MPNKCTLSHNEETLNILRGGTCQREVELQHKYFRGRRRHASLINIPHNILRVLIIHLHHTHCMYIIYVSAGDDKTTIYRRRSICGPLTHNSLTEKEKRQKGGTITQEHRDYCGLEAGTLLRLRPQQNPRKILNSLKMITVPR